MNLVWFLAFGAFGGVVLGEFGRFPFGGGNISITILDILLSLTLVFLAIWQIGIKKDLSFLKILKSLIPFYLIAFLSLIISLNLKGSLYLFRFFIYSFSFWLGYSLIKSKITNLKKINNLIIFSGIFLSILGFLQLLTFPDLEFLTIFGFDPHKYRLVSSFLDPNLLGAFLNICLGISLYSYFKEKSKLFIILSLILSLAIILTFSRSAYLFLAIQIFLWAVFRMKKIILFSLIFLVLISLLIPRFKERVVGGLYIDSSAKERIESWQDGLTIFRKNILLGVGFNNLRDAYQDTNLLKTYSLTGGHSGAGVDSSFIFILASTGILGFVAYGYFIIHLFKFKTDDDLLKYTQNILLVGLLLNSQFINSLFFTPIMFIVFTWLGAIRGLR